MPSFSFGLGFAASILDEIGMIAARNAVMRLPGFERGNMIDGFDAFADWSMIMRAKCRAARAAFKYARVRPGYAVVYDYGDRPDIDFDESYYEMFSSPGEARRMFRDAYPSERDEAHNARLVLILGPIDDYTAG
jgi:hypothetical protein